MRYLVLACDYDGTIASGGLVAEDTLAALRRCVASGRKLILVTGRQLDDLLTVFPHPDLFERIVAENGALLYRPADAECRLLAEQPAPEFIERLRDKGIPLSVGEVIVATISPHETPALEVIRDMGLEWQVIFNKGAVMMLPAGIHKGTGLATALSEIGLSPHNVVAIGDAENDQHLLAMCECAVAVSNALPIVQQRADYVTEGPSGEGTAELVEKLLDNDLADLEPALTRHHVLLGVRDDDTDCLLNPYATNLMIAGSSGSGKSTVMTGLLERLSEKGYQFCIVDPEGDYESLGGAVMLGDRQHIPGTEEVIQLLSQPQPTSNAVLNLLGVPLQDRPAFFAAFFPRLQELRTRTGRPHWLVVDEAHHLLPSTWDPASLTLQKIESMAFITVHPDQVAPTILSAIDVLVVVGEAPDETFRKFSRAIGRPAPRGSWPALQPGDVLVWQLHMRTDPFRIHIVPSRADHRRHRRKYAEGELGPDRSFYFQGPEGKLNLRAQNLVLFLQLAEGIDDETWTYHLRRGDYSRWFREAIKSDHLADKARRVEEQRDLSPADSRAQIKAAIDEEFTLPASSTTPLHASIPPKAKAS